MKRNYTGFILQAIHWNTRCRLTYSLNLHKCWTFITVKSHQDFMQAATAADLYWSRCMFVSQLGGNDRHEEPRSWTSSQVCCVQLQPPLEDSVHPPGFLRKMHLRTSEGQSVWRSMRSFTLAAWTCLGAAAHTYPLHLRSLAPYRGGALCQPWSGTYYRSCWNDGF